MLDVRTLLGAPLMAGALTALLWRRVRPARSAGDWYDEPLADDVPPSPLTAALFTDDALVTQLICGDISGAEYRRAIEQLAASDAARFPFGLPPSGGR
jgi:hypothetical protein